MAEKPGVSLWLEPGKPVWFLCPWRVIVHPRHLRDHSKLPWQPKRHYPEMAGQMDYIAYKEEQYDKLAEILRESLDMEKNI